MDHSRALLPGSMIVGGWRIERVLGQGGFGVTYEARHRATGAHAALKEYMPSGLCTRAVDSGRITAAQGPAADIFKRGLAGFIKEAETLARLDHPSIVRVTKFFEANGTAYMALAFESGGNLSDWLQGLGRQPTQIELDRLLWPLSEALIQVHSLHLLHRDIKPDNIMLRPDGRPVLIDFGAVKQLVSSHSRTVNGPATLNVATDGFAPPEQYVANGESLLGPWTDVYALAATLYQTATGKPPPAAPRRTVDETYRPLAAGGFEGRGWRPTFLAGVDRALALKRSERPQSIVEFRTAIGLTAPPPSSSAAHALRFHGEKVMSVVAEPRQGYVAVPREKSGAEPGNADQSVVSRGPSIRVPDRDRMPPPSHPGALRLTDGSPPAVAGSGQRTGQGLPSGDWNAIASEPRPPQTATGGSDLWATTGVVALLVAGVTIFVHNAGTSADKEEPTPTATATARRTAAISSDAIAALVPGSGKSARDRLADGSVCAFCPELVAVPAGSFTMGSPENEPQRSGQEQQVPVSIPRPFAVGKFAVTFDEWDACVADSGCNGHRPADQGWGRGRRPVINVNWDDAKAYAAWVSRKTGKTYRLLAEAEREYVTRAGTTTPFWWGTSIAPAQANYDGSVYKGGGSKGEYRGQTLQVDSFQANPWGLFNVHGNVWEWTEDCWIDRNTGIPGNGEARTTGCTDADLRVARGGSWFDLPQHLRSASRTRFIPYDRKAPFLSFRLARTL